MALTQVFVSISDPRSARQVRHDLSELLTVAVCAVLCSADEFTEVYGADNTNTGRGVRGKPARARSVL